MSVTNRTTFQGVSLSNAKKMAEYEFGDAIIKIDVDTKNQTYEIHIIDSIKKETVVKFTDYWKGNFKVKVYSLKYEL